MLIDRYLRREILKPLAGTCSLLVVIFAGYSATRFLDDAANGLLTGKTATILILLKVLIALEVLLPITLYLSVVMALGHMHANSEMIAMQAAGIGEKRIRRTVFRVSLILAILVY